MMSRYDGFKNKEIAESQCITVKAVEFHINKALSHLRDDLSKEYLIPIIFLILYIGLKKIIVLFVCLIIKVLWCCYEKTYQKVKKISIFY